MSSHHFVARHVALRAFRAGGADAVAGKPRAQAIYGRGSLIGDPEGGEPIYGKVRDQAYLAGFDRRGAAARELPPDVARQVRAIVEPERVRSFDDGALTGAG